MALPGRPRRTSSGWLSRARMATPFHADWPCQIAPYPTIQRRGGEARVGRLQFLQADDVRRPAGQASSAASRVWMPLTLKVAIFRVSTACLRE